METPSVMSGNACVRLMVQRPVAGSQPGSVAGMLNSMLSTPATPFVARSAALSVHWSPGVKMSVSQRLTRPTPAASPVVLT